jgi:hypothetical protein
MMPSAPTGSGAVETTWWQTADGLQAFRGAFDTQGAHDCALFDIDGTTGVCDLGDNNFATGVRGGPVLTSDSSCTQLVLGVTTGCPPPPIMTSFPVAGGAYCFKEAPTFNAVGPTVASTALFETTNGTCGPATGVSTVFTYYTEGAPITVPSFSIEVATTPSLRLEPKHFTNGTFSAREVRLFDTMLKTECVFEQTPAGLACVPAIVAGVLQGFTDSACTSPIKVAEVVPAPTGCTPVAVPTYAVGSPFEVDVVGNRHGGTVFVNTGGTCSAVVGNVQFFDITGTIPNGMLATGTRVVDP